MRGVKSFESWDETYVHNELSDDRRVLMVRAHEGGYEPWTWVRQQGKGRVYYTASGHDERTWKLAGLSRAARRGHPLGGGPSERRCAAARLTKSTDVGLPNYTPGAAWGTQGAPIMKVQKPKARPTNRRTFICPPAFTPSCSPPSRT